MKSKLIIIGAGNFAEIAAYLFENEADYEVIAHGVDRQYIQFDDLRGKPVFPLDEIVEKFSPDQYKVFVAIGIQDLNQKREQKCAQLASWGYELVSFISPHALVAKDLILHPNTMIMAGCIIHPMVTVGANCILWTNTTIGLKSVVQDHCWLVSAGLGESTFLGNNTFVGIEATIAPFVKIGAYSLIGIRALVLKDAPPYTVYGAGAKTPSKVSAKKAAKLVR